LHPEVSSLRFSLNEVYEPSSYWKGKKKEEEGEEEEKR
jgi:hypothetical protein